MKFQSFPGVCKPTARPRQIRQMLGTGTRLRRTLKSMYSQVRRAEYKAKVIEGLRLEDTSHRPGLTAEDLAAIKETIGRKAAGFLG